MGRVVIIVTLPWSEIMGGYKTPDTMVEMYRLQHGLQLIMRL